MLASLFHGNAPTMAATEATCESPAHELSASRNPLGPKSWSSGSARTPEMPNCARAGPDARTSTGSEPKAPCPPTTKPMIKTPFPVPTADRHEMSTSRPASSVALTASVAALLVTEFPKLVTTHEYEPASAAAAPPMISVDSVAPEIAAPPKAPFDTGLPFSIHWYVAKG